MIKCQKIIVVVALIFLISCFISGVYVIHVRGIAFLRKEQRWSIGIYVGESPFDLVSAENITDVSADFVADPFMVRENYTWYMFFEVMNTHTNQGDIGLAISNDGFNWIYKQIILDEPFHLSYPYVFKWKNEYYMVPESYQANSIRLYKAVDFPTQWSFVGTLLDGIDPHQIGENEWVASVDGFVEVLVFGFNYYRIKHLVFLFIFINYLLISLPYHVF